MKCVCADRKRLQTGGQGGQGRGQLVVFIKGGEEVFVFGEGSLSLSELHRQTGICVQEIRLTGGLKTAETKR